MFFALCANRRTVLWKQFSFLVTKTLKYIQQKFMFSDVHCLSLLFLFTSANESLSNSIHPSIF